MPKQLNEIQPSERVCFNCAYGTWDERTKQIICRLLPPTVVLVQVPNPNRVQSPDAPPFVPASQSLFVSTAPDWWCGQFEPKTEQVKS